MNNPAYDLILGGKYVCLHVPKPLQIVPAPQTDQQSSNKLANLTAFKEQNKFKKKPKGVKAKLLPFANKNSSRNAQMLSHAHTPPTQGESCTSSGYSQ